jgi:antimicrobial peptide system SdpB family protein
MSSDEASQLPWTNVYGLARSLIALGTLVTLAKNDPAVLWHPASGIPVAPVCSELTGHTSLFCFLSSDLNLARWIAVAVLALVVSGYRPRITGPLHCWITHSFVTTALMVDGGDHLSATLSLLLLPLTLTDARRWHWSEPAPLPDTPRANLRVGLASATLWVMRLQVAIVYLNAAAAKWGNTEWADGTALYYWFSDPAFGLTPPLRAAFGTLIENRYSVTFMTWGVIAFEFTLFAALFMRARVERTLLLAMGITFHLAIAFVHGLPSFALIVFGALLLLLRREHERFEWLEPRAYARDRTSAIANAFGRGRGVARLSLRRP